MLKKVIIVGGVAGGASTAARLRRNDENVSIILFEKGKHISYANCGLPYYIGNVIEDREQLFVQTPGDFSKRFNLDIRVRSEVISIDIASKRVEVLDLEKNEKYFETYDKLVLSPGAKPFIPPLEGISNDGIFTLRNVEDTDRIKDFLNSRKPKRAVIIGAGYIGIEMADNLKQVCSSVTVVEMADRVIPFFDYEMSAMIEQHLRYNEVEVLLNETVTAISVENSMMEGRAPLCRKVVLKSGNQLKADIIILAAGVRPDTAFLKDSGIKLLAGGSIPVNQHLQTNIPDVYALGDAALCRHKVLGYDLNIYLAGPASKQGRIVADNITGDNSEVYQGTVGTAIIKVFELTAGYTGISEDSLKKQQRPYFASYTHNFHHAGYYPAAMPMTIKLLFAPESGEIYGAQVVGYEGVDKRLDVIAAFIHKNGTIYDLSAYDHAYAPPFSSSKDPVTIAGLVAENIIKGKVKVVHWNDITPEFLADKTLIDVRTAEENAFAAIPGDMLIPLDELRDRINEIPTNKPVVIYCRAGQRGYLACRILMQKGFKDIYNLSGGYKIYEIAKHLVCCQDVFQQELEEAAEMTVSEPAPEIKPLPADNTVKLYINACGLQCPGPIIKLKEGIDGLKDGEMLEIQATDPGFINDLKAWCRVTANPLVNLSKTGATNTAQVRKGERATAASITQAAQPLNLPQNKTLIVFSDDMDRALASFVIANGAAALGREVTMFFTFWGLNVIKREHKPNSKRDFMGFMFGKMMPSDSKKLNLSKMNMLGMGSKMMRYRMKSKQVDSLEGMIAAAIKNGVRLIACQMSMDVMGVVKEDLIDGVEIGGVATYLEEAEKSNINLFI